VGKVKAGVCGIPRANSASVREYPRSGGCANPWGFASVMENKTQHLFYCKELPVGHFRRTQGARMGCYTSLYNYVL
jgi:hypothetical protein